MAIFKLTSDDSRAVIVRANCADCARELCFEAGMGDEWMDRNRTTVELVQPHGKAAIIAKVEE